MGTAIFEGDRISMRICIFCGEKVEYDSMVATISAVYGQVVLIKTQKRYVCPKCKATNFYDDFKSVEFDKE